MIQTETQRQFYLGVAGIRLWYAREPLPGAAPSPKFQFPEPDQLEHQPARGEIPVVGLPAKAKTAALSSDASQRGIKRIASLQALMENKKEPAPNEEVQEPQPPVVEGQFSQVSEGTVVTVPESQDGTGQTLSLSMCVFSGDHYILIAHISKEASLRLQETLAANILKSLGEKSLGVSEWVQWPVFNNRLVPGSSLADLQSVMAQVFNDAGAKKVIVLGALEGARTGSGWLVEALKRAPDVEYEHSLAELASNPGLKRSLWQLLKPLVTA